jgi:hypothetical protein
MRPIKQPVKIHGILKKVYGSLPKLRPVLFPQYMLATSGYGYCKIRLQLTQKREAQ